MLQRFRHLLHHPLETSLLPVIRFQTRLAMASSSKYGTLVTKDNVEHDDNLNEFYIHLKDGSNEGKAFLQYSHIRPDYVDLEHTVVPPEFRGQGIAKVLAQTVFDYFVERNILMRPTCTYLQKFYNENQLPQYAKCVKWD